MNAMQPPQSVEEVKATLETTEKGGVRQSIRNCLTVFQRDPVLAGAIAYNILTDRKDIIKPIGFHRESTALTDTDMKYLLLYLEETYGLTSEKKIETAIGIVANENKYHPIRDFLNSLAWDGTERIRFCLRHFLGADVDDYTYEALKLFMLGAITRAFKPGSKFEIMLCLVGGQGAGKSTFFRLLAVRDEWFSDDLRKLDDDNVYRKLQGHWIIEMSEMMATANAKSIEEIKSFLSRQKEVYKIPYETHPADRPRQCVFGGTSNALDFLPLDRSGNRRFIPVMVYPEQAEVHILEDEAASTAYISQMWAEAMEIYRSGMFKLSFSPAMQRYLKEHQRDFMPEDTKAGMIQAYLDKYTGSMVCSKQLYKEALNHGLVLVREQILHHVVRGNIGLVRHFDEHADAADIRVEAQLAALQINVAGQDVIEDNVFDEIAAVILFIVILLDAVQRNSQKADIFCGFRVVAGDEHCVFRARAAAEGFICVVAGNKCSLRCNVFRRYGFRYFADLAELAARDNHGGLVDDADRAVNGITHLMNDALKQSIGHDFLFSPSLQIQSCAVFDGSRTVIHSLCYLYYRIKTDFSSLFEYFF